MVQWLGFSAFTAAVQVQSLVQKLRSHFKLLHAALKKPTKQPHSHTHTHTHTPLKMKEDLYVRAKTIKHLETTINLKLCDLRSGNNS